MEQGLPNMLRQTQKALRCALRPFALRQIPVGLGGHHRALGGVLHDWAALQELLYTPDHGGLCN